MNRAGYAPLRARMASPYVMNRTAPKPQFQATGSPPPQPSYVRDATPTPRPELGKVSKQFNCGHAPQRRGAAKPHAAHRYS